MGKIDKIAEFPEIMSVVAGCTRRSDCSIDTKANELFVADLERLDVGKPTEHGLSLELVLEDRITFAAMCNPTTCETTGMCALNGFFRDTTPEMAAAQDTGRVLQIRRDQS